MDMSQTLKFCTGGGTCITDVDKKRVRGLHADGSLGQCQPTGCRIGHFICPSSDETFQPKFFHELQSCIHSVLCKDRSFLWCPFIWCKSKDCSHAQPCATMTHQLAWPDHVKYSRALHLLGIPDLPLSQTTSKMQAWQLQAIWSSTLLTSSCRSFLQHLGVSMHCGATLEPLLLHLTRLKSCVFPAVHLHCKWATSQAKWHNRVTSMNFVLQALQTKWARHKKSRFHNSSQKTSHPKLRMCSCR